MRTVSVYVYSQDQQIKCRIEIIKNAPPKIEVPDGEYYDDDGPHKASTTEVLALQGYPVQENHFLLKMRSDQSQDLKTDYTIRKIILDLPDEILPSLHMLYSLNRICKTEKSQYILTGDRFITDEFSLSDGEIKYLTPFSIFLKTMDMESPVSFYELETSLMEYIGSKIPLSSINPISEYVADEIIKLNPSLIYLEALKLLNPEVSEDKKKNILNQLADYMLHQEDSKLYQKTMDYLNYHVKDNLFDNCHGKIALDGGRYYDNYTEIQLLRAAQFNPRDDGRISIVLKNNRSYQNHYAEGKRNFAIIEDELRFLGKIIDLEFSDDSDFHKEIIFTPACSEKLIKMGLIYNTQYLEKLMSTLQTTLPESESEMGDKKIGENPNLFFARDTSLNANSCLNTSEKGLALG